MRTMGTKIRHAMERKNWSKTYVSMHTGISVYNLAKMMNDSLAPRAIELYKMSKLFGEELE